MAFSTNVYLAVEAALKAGEEILRIYKTDFEVETKSDKTPVTMADKASGKIIEKLLAQSGIPVISEEETLADYSLRRSWSLVWIVDPLDGTKEFVKRNGEFAVNIALVQDQKPIIGVIYAPVFKELYFAESGQGGFKLEITDEASSVGEHMNTALKLPVKKLPADYTVVASRSHLSRDVYQHVGHLKKIYGAVTIINSGSSIKQCWVAAGLAHEYPRFGTTMEWDTAAGQCILEEAGGALLDLERGTPLLYNKRDMQNNYFIARSSV